MQIEADHRRRSVSRHVELVHFHSEHDEQAAVRQVAVLASLRQPLGRYRRSVSRYCVCEVFAAGIGAGQIAVDSADLASKNP